MASTHAFTIEYRNVWIEVKIKESSGRRARCVLQTISPTVGVGSVALAMCELNSLTEGTRRLRLWFLQRSTQKYTDGRFSSRNEEQP